MLTSADKLVQFANPHLWDSDLWALASVGIKSLDDLWMTPSFRLAEILDDVQSVRRVSRFRMAHLNTPSASEKNETTGASKKIAGSYVIPGKTAMGGSNRITSSQK